MGRPGNPYAGGQAFIGGEAAADLDFEFRTHTGDAWRDLTPPWQDHRAISLGPSVFDHLEALGMYTALSIGN